jgi:DNA-directed RNA polymerase subunit RPC12/RpoP
MMPPRSRRDFEDLEASQLYCPRCKRAMPVRKRLLLVLLDRETFDYVCAGCGSPIGKKEEPLRAPPSRIRI